MNRLSVISRLLAIGIFFILLITFAEQLSDYCILPDGTQHRVNSTWISKKGCQCQCDGSTGINIELCENCKRIQLKNPLSEIASENSCQYNGFTYLKNETWMSSDTECAQCRCSYGGRASCVSDKHCTNTCANGDIPIYGKCCEIENCGGKTPPIGNGISCTVENKSLSHGSRIIRKEKCISKSCICDNGRLVCHNYCDLSIQPLTYHNRLCCPTIMLNNRNSFHHSVPPFVVNKSCNYNSRLFLSGETVYFKENNENCTCFEAKAQCFEVESTLNTTVASTQITWPILYILICLITFLAITFVIIILYTTLIRNRKKRKTKNDKEANSVLLDALQNNTNEDDTITV